MIHLLLNSFVETFTFLNVFKYITLRSGLALLTGFLIYFFCGDRFICKMKEIQNGGQPIRENGPESHFSKKGTPTMGGLLWIFSILVSTLFWAEPNVYILISLFVLVSFAILGFMDDYLKVSKRNTKGVPGKLKLLWQLVTSLAATYIILLQNPESGTLLTFPFFKHLIIDLGIFYFIFAAIVITGASNAVNLTDGLDGLATGPIVMVAFCFGVICYITGNAVFSQYLQIINIPQSGELSILCGSIIGAGLGFLWFNAPPAQVFMGDVGSLALGGALGIISIIAKNEIVLAIAGGLFVIEALSVILQVASFKTRGVRIFKMAPIHHHFEKLGWSETKVVIRFWIISLIFVILALATLKLR